MDFGEGQEEGDVNVGVECVELVLAIIELGVRRQTQG
jgi:hypothetical protein